MSDDSGDVDDASGQVLTEIAGPEGARGQRSAHVAERVFPRGQPRRGDIRAHAFHLRQRGQLRHARTNLRARKKRLPLTASSLRLRECSRGPRALSAPRPQALEGAGHRELFHGRGAHMSTPCEVRLARKRSLATSFDDAFCDRAQASYLIQADAHREAAIDIEGNGAARG